VGAWAHNTISWAVDGRRELSGACVAVSVVVVTVWVLDTALDAVSGAVTAGFVVVIGGDVAAKRRGSGPERWGCGVSGGAVDRLGSVCRRFRAVGGGGSCWDSSREVVVGVVDNNDGGCVGADGGDVAALVEKGGLVTREVGSFLVWVVASVAFVVVCMLKSTRGAVLAFFVEVEPSSSAVGVTWVVASMTIGVAGVTWMSTSAVVAASVWVSTSSSKTAPRNSARA
jgi:hypothetical protein